MPSKAAHVVITWFFSAAQFLAWKVINRLLQWMHTRDDLFHCGRQKMVKILFGRPLVDAVTDPAHFPSDRWIVDTALKLLDRERHDLGVILLAQMDDAQHAFGTVSDPDEFVPCGSLRCDYHSARNPITKGFRTKFRNRKEKFAKGHVGSGAVDELVEAFENCHRNPCGPDLIGVDTLEEILGVPLEYGS